jgi:alcohol/geraniol dehydrogenase (NADP+)
MIKAYAAHQKGGKLLPFEYDPGVLGPSEVEINVAYCGVCHSDLSMLNNEWGITNYPFVPGHEIIGSIAAKGEKVKKLQLGQQVGLGWHSNYCMDCHMCMSGDHNLCAEAEQTIVGRHGGFADKVRAHANSVIPLPEHIDSQSAGPLFCGGITVFNPLLQFNIKPTDKVAVIGIGGLGHLALQFMNAWGCHVTAFTSNESKKKEVLKLGAHQTLNSRNPSDLKSAAGQYDLILSTVNAKLDWNAFIATLRPKGRLHFVGAVLEPLDIEIFSLIMGQRSISGSPVGNPANLKKMLDFSAQHKIKPVIETYHFEQVNQALDRLARGEVRYRIVLKHK